MIEPFEYEPRKLAAKAPSGHVGAKPVGGGASIDQDMRFPSLRDSMEDIKLDTSQRRIFQTKIGNPANENASTSDLVVDRVVGLGPLVVSENAPQEATDVSSMTSSEIFSRILDRERFVPSSSKHVLPSMKINSLSSPFMEPGLTTSYIHSFTPNWT